VEQFPSLTMCSLLLLIGTLMMYGARLMITILYKNDSRSVRRWKQIRISKRMTRKKLTLIMCVTCITNMGFELIIIYFMVKRSFSHKRKTTFRRKKRATTKRSSKAARR